MRFIAKPKDNTKVYVVLVNCTSVCQVGNTLVVRHTAPSTTTSIVDVYDTGDLQYWEVTLAD
jgi:hypothetical protein